MRLFGDFKNTVILIDGKVIFWPRLLKSLIVIAALNLKSIFSLVLKIWFMYFKRKNDVHTSSHLWSNDFDEKSFLYFIQPTLLELGNEVWKFAIAIFCECVYADYARFEVKQTHKI